MERRLFETLKSCEVILMNSNNKRMNSTQLMKTLLPSGVLTDYGSGKGAFLKAYDLHIKRDKRKNEYHIVLGISPTTVKKGKFSTTTFTGYSRKFEKKESAELVYDTLTKKVKELGGNILEYDFSVEGSIEFL